MCPVEHTFVCLVWSLTYLYSAGSLTMPFASCPCRLFTISHACHPLLIAPINMIGISLPSSTDSCLVSDPTTLQCPLGHVLNWSVPVSLGLLSALPETSCSTSTLLPRSPLKRLLCRVAFLYHWPRLVGCFTDCQPPEIVSHCVFPVCPSASLLDSGIL